VLPAGEDGEEIGEEGEGERVPGGVGLVEEAVEVKGGGREGGGCPGEEEEPEGREGGREGERMSPQMQGGERRKIEKEEGTGRRRKGGKEEGRKGGRERGREGGDAPGLHKLSAPLEEVFLQGTLHHRLCLLQPPFLPPALPPALPHALPLPLAGSLHHAGVGGSIRVY
jgi:hypothetical protein